MTVEASASLAEPPPREQEAAEPSKPRLEARIATVLLALLPGALVVYFSFSSGGFFPSSVGFACLLVIQMIVLRVLVTENPFGGYTRRLGVVTLLFTAFTGWTLLSQLWSDADGRALVEFDRALLYLAVLVLLGLVPRRRWRMPWILRGLAIGILFVCTCALITRLLPRVWPIEPGLADDRLSFPLTYWNALGILATVGMILALGIAANPHERRWGNALAAAFVPVAATTLFFTFSRGAIIAAVIGVVVYLLVARSQTLIGTLLATAPPTVVALLVAYDADLLASVDPTSNAAADQGQTVAIALLVCAIAAGAVRFLTVSLDRRLARRRRTQWPRQRKLGFAGGALAAVLIAAVVAGVPSKASDQFDKFLNAPPTTSTDLRDRFADPSSNGRKEHWDAALKGFSAQPLHGQGAGTYQYTWDRYRQLNLTVVDGHSLYFEVLSEFGVVGLALLLATIGTILWTLLRGVKGPNRMVYAALFAAVLAWAIHAGVDWDWEMPAVTIWVFAVGGAALAGRMSKKPPPAMGDRGRIPIAASLLVVAVTPALLMLSQYKLQSSADAFENGTCRTAVDDAMSSINVLGNRAQPYQIVGYCNIENGRPQDGVAAFKKAVEQEPRGWEYHYGLALARGASGLDPKPELAVAARLNPREPMIAQARTALASADPTRWESEATKLAADARVSGRLSLR